MGKDHILKNSGMVLNKADNYNNWQYEQFKRYVGKEVLEVGCGLGNITQYLIHNMDFLLGTDIKPEAIDFVKQRFQDDFHEDRFAVKCIDIFSEELNVPQHFDTIICSNVLEHIEDDLGAMKICHQILSEKKGYFLLLVPAHQFIYGTLDEESGHVKRYSKKEIIELAEWSNFEVVDLYLFNFVGAVGWYINYCLLKRRNTNNEESSAQMSFFDKLCVKPLKLMESLIKPIIGISYIAILKAK